MKKNYYIKFFLTLLLTYLFLIFNAKSEIIKKFLIEGNVRIGNETIISFLPVKLNDEIVDNDLNFVLKTLYDTNFFKNINLKFENNELLIQVVENPIIQSITYNGVKSERLRQSITENVKLKARSSFVEIYVEQDMSLITNNLKQEGYYFSKINPKIENLDDNKVNLVYEINLGKKAKIKKITFTGNKIFKDKRLKNIILSEEYKFWKFLSGKKFLNEDLVNFDRRLLNNFYINKGFYNVKISSTFAKLIADDEFELIYNIDAGEKIYFGEFKINLPLNYDQKNFINLTKTLNELNGQPYSINAIEKITEEIDIIALYEQYESINIDVLENFEGNKINITFLIEESEKTSIKKINIFGNNVTRENVIRNQFEIDEGDFFNEILLTKTINNLKSLNFFKTVQSKVNSDSTTKDKIIDITVDEKPTGEIGASAGVGTSGNSIGIFVKENNYLGKGLALESNLSLGSDSIKGLLSINNPNFNNSDKSVYSRVEATEIDKLTDFGYKTNRTGFLLGTNFEYLQNLTLGVGNKNYYQNIETDSTASRLQQKQEGDYFDSFVNLDFDYDKRNQKFRPTDGFRSFYSLDVPVISKTNTLTNVYDLKLYSELYENNVTSIAFYVKTSNSLSNDNIKLTERNFLPGSKLRGFETGKVGPKDGDDFIGGNYISSVNVSTTLPKILQESQNLDFIFFLDAGNVWGVDYDSSLNDSNKIRSSLGLGIDWLTPIGPLNFTLSQPITKAESDSTETFRFNLGTSF
jgi:outer membrane protein insertion porin family